MTEDYFTEPNVGQKKPITIGQIKVYLVWFDSIGAKSSCILIETPDLKILVDPGVAVMQPSFPLPDEGKLNLCQIALQAIRNAAQKADTVFISHYHYDHHTLPLGDEQIYENKQIWIKDPNLWINQSQWDRARLFLMQLYEAFGGTDPESIVRSPIQTDIKDPLENLPLAMAKDYGDYQNRKFQLLKKGRTWFEKLTKVWLQSPWISEFVLDKLEVHIADGRSFAKGSTQVKFTQPLFHGIEYDRVGWIIALVVEHDGTKVVYTSDLQGPSIEDYSQWIIQENPDILILDGPATYLFGYMVNRINLQRAVDNVCAVIIDTDTKVIIYDHHLTRDTRFKERIEEVYTTAEKVDKTFLTAAEWLGFKPLVLKLGTAYT